MTVKPLQKQPVPLSHIASDISLSLSNLSTQQKLSKHARRAKDLSKHIQLDISVFDLFQMGSMNEYELYVRSFGAEKNIQISTQTGQDTAQVDAQTDDWEICDQWTQAPPSQLVESASDSCKLPWLIQKEHKPRRDKNGVVEYTARMESFVARAGLVIDCLLNEQVPEYEKKDFGNEDLFKSPTNLTFLPKYGVSGITMLANGMIAVSQVGSGIEAQHPLVKTLITIWKMQDQVPCKRLICYPSVSTVFSSINSPTLVLAGTEDASLQIWDLRESGDTLWPCFSTDSCSMRHSSRICSLYQSSSFEHTTSFQISSVDADGGVQSWVCCFLIPGCDAY